MSTLNCRLSIEPINVLQAGYHFPFSLHSYKNLEEEKENEVAKPVFSKTKKCDEDEALMLYEQYIFGIYNFNSNTSNEKIIIINTVIKWRISMVITIFF